VLARGTKAGDLWPAIVLHRPGAQDYESCDCDMNLEFCDCVVKLVIWDLLESCSMNLRICSELGCDEMHEIENMHG
jgi:hypothetical protein